MGVQLNPHVTGTGLYPAFRRAMVFIDGENLVCRFQDMRAQGAAVHPSVKHMRDVFVWSQDSIKIAGLYEIERASYYTYCTGDPAAVEHAEREVKSQTFTPHLGSQLPSNLFPRVFWKQKGSSGKGVDIQMSVDILAHAYRDNYDILYLISGDGDYRPLVEEVARVGKQIYVAALSSGLNPALSKVADVFVDLDPYYFVK